MSSQRVEQSTGQYYTSPQLLPACNYSLPACPSPSKCSSAQHPPPSAAVHLHIATVHKLQLALLNEASHQCTRVVILLLPPACEEAHFSICISHRVRVQGTWKSGRICTTRHTTAATAQPHGYVSREVHAMIQRDSALTESTPHR